MKELEHKVSYLDSGEERIKALLELSSLVSDTDFLRSWILANQAIQEAEQFGLKSMWAMANVKAGNALWKLADYPQALEHYQEALTIYETLEDYVGLSNTYCGIGIVHGELEERETAKEYFEKGIEAAKKAGRENFAATLMSNIGFLHLGLYEYDEALECFLSALEIQEQNNDEWNKANALGGIAGAYVYLRKYNQGLEYLEKNLQLHQKLNNQRGIALSLMNYGETHYQLGNHGGAVQYCMRALEVAEKTNLHSTKFKIHQIISKAYTAMGDEEAAYKHAKLYAEAEKEAKLIEIQRKMEKYKQLKEIKDMRQNA